MTISWMDFNTKRLSVTVCPVVLRIVTIFCLSYFHLIRYFGCFIYICFCLVIGQVFSLLFMHIGCKEKYKESLSKIPLTSIKMDLSRIGCALYVTFIVCSSSNIERDCLHFK